MSTSIALAVFAFVLANLAVALGCFVMAFFIMPRLRITLNVTLVAGMVFFAVTGLQMLDVDYELLFGDATRIGSNWRQFWFRLIMAVSLTVFVSGILLDVAQWKTLRLRMTGRKGDERGHD